jgi:Zn-dependent alcohol dehydrogenase
VLSWIKGDGINAESAAFVDSNNMKVNSGKVTTFSSFSVASENCVYLAPAGFNEKLLALFGCALLTGGGMALKYGYSVEIRKICIIGFGGIGSAAALVLKGMGKPEVDIIEKSLEKRGMAVSLGFKQVYSTVSEGLTDYDLVIEASGSVDSIESGFSRLSDSGTLVFASHPETGLKISLDPHDLIKGKKIFGTWGGDINPDTEMATIGKLLVDSGANLNLLLGDIFTIEEVNQGMAYLNSGKVGRPLLKFNEV